MKKIYLVATLLGGCFTLLAQRKDFNNDDYFYYRNHLYLNTSSILLNAAGLKATAYDTASAIAYITQAANLGLYDTMFITTSNRNSYITKRKEWPAIRQIILNNAKWFSEPEQMEISFTDIDNFWKIYDRLNQPGAAELLMNEYILIGSPGLRTFFEKRMGLQPANMLDLLRKKKQYFNSIRQASQQLYRYKPAIIEAAKKIKEIYPEAYFPPTYLTIGIFNTFGTADGGAGQLIGAEFLTDIKTVDTAELSRFEKTGMADTSKISGIIIHELVHTLQQTAQDDRLLARCIDEGAADFITQLVLGYNNNLKMHDFGNTHEKELWKQFNSEMTGTNTEAWLYNGMAATAERPGDLGYYIGYKICEAYYNKTADKKQAVKDILHIKDYDAFLKLSGYAPGAG